MNKLSLFLYLIDVLDTFRTGLYIFSWIGLVSNAVVLVITGICIGEAYRDDDSSKARDFRNKYMKRTLPFVFVGFLIAMALPNQRTMVLIAASEVGEKIVTSDTVRNVVDPSVGLLKAWMEKETLSIQEEMRKQIEGINKKKEEKK